MATNTIDRLPPQNIELEESILGALMLDKNVIIKVADILEPDDFYKTGHQLIYETILELFNNREPIDILTVSNRLRERKALDEIGGASYLTSLINKVPTTYHTEEYAKLVHKKRILRELISASYDISRLANTEDEEVDNVLDQAEQLIFQISKKKIDQSFSQIKDELSLAFERIDTLQKGGGKLRGVTTGFKCLDNMLSGLQKSDMVVLGARPSMGKTSLGLDIARGAAMRGYGVGVFSLEMSKDQLVDRLIAAESTVNLWKIRTGCLSSSGEMNDFTLLNDAISRLAEAPIYIDDSPGLTPLQIRTKARRLMAEAKIDLIVIDYLQMIMPSNSYAPAVQQYTEVSRSIKSLARELEVPVLILSQLSRSVEQRQPPVPKLSDLRETGCVTGDTLIMRADTGELVKIKDLVDKNIKLPMPVYSLDNDYSMVVQKMSKAFSSGKKMVYELKLKSGAYIKASANHPFWGIKGWSRLDELNIGDYIATPRELKISKPQNLMSKDEIILLAHLLGDGCILSRQPYHYTSADMKNIEIVAKTVKKLFKIESKIIKQKNWWHIYLTSPQHLTHKVYHPITKWFDDLGIKRVHSYDKEIPAKIFSLDNEHIALFLKHLWATDGNISLKEKKNNKIEPAIYYSSTSYALAWGVRHLLLRLGIRSKITEKRKGSYRICYIVSIYSSSEHLKFLQTIGCFGKRGEMVPELIKRCKKIVANPNIDLWPKEIWELIIDPIREFKGVSWGEFKKSLNTRRSREGLFKLGISNSMMKKIAKCLKSPIIDNLLKSDICWDQIISIKKLGIQEVFDATVPGLHNFIANDIILENSIEQDADVVMLIYRDDRYNKNSANPNVAEILVAKHRNGPVGQVELYFNQEIASFRELDKTFEGSESEGGYEQLTPPDVGFSGPVDSSGEESEFLGEDEIM